MSGINVHPLFLGQDLVRGIPASLKKQGTLAETFKVSYDTFLCGDGKGGGQRGQFRKEIEIGRGYKIFLKNGRRHVTER